MTEVNRLLCTAGFLRPPLATSSLEAGSRALHHLPPLSARPVTAVSPHSAFLDDWAVLSPLSQAVACLSPELGLMDTH